MRWRPRGNIEEEEVEEQRQGVEKREGLGGSGEAWLAREHGQKEPYGK